MKPKLELALIGTQHHFYKGSPAHRHPKPQALHTQKLNSKPKPLRRHLKVHHPNQTLWISEISSKHGCCTSTPSSRASLAPGTSAVAAFCHTWGHGRSSVSKPKVRDARTESFGFDADLHRKLHASASSLTRKSPVTQIYNLKHKWKGTPMQVECRPRSSMLMDPVTKDPALVSSAAKLAKAPLRAPTLHVVEVHGWTARALKPMP